MHNYHRQTASHLTGPHSCRHHHLDLDNSGPANLVRCSTCSTVVDFGLASYQKR